MFSRAAALPAGTPAPLGGVAGCSGPAPSVAAPSAPSEAAGPRRQPHPPPPRASGRAPPVANSPRRFARAARSRAPAEASCAARLAAGRQALHGPLCGLRFFAWPPPSPALPTCALPYGSPLYRRSGHSLTVLLRTRGESSASPIHAREIPVSFDCSPGGERADSRTGHFGRISDGILPKSPTRESAHTARASDPVFRT